MYIDEELAEAEVVSYALKPHFVIYSVNVYFPDIEHRIRGITVQPSKFGGLWVQMPRYQDKSGAWRSPNAAPERGLFFKLIDKLVKNAVAAYTADNYVPSAADLDKPLTEEDISFDENQDKPP